METLIKRETKCDKCSKFFYRKLRPPKAKGGKRELTKINEVSY
jgi:hypothetical protein